MRWLLAFSVFAAGCVAGGPTGTEKKIAGTDTGGDPVLVGAGDIAECRGDELTARLLDSIPGTVFTAGDNAYYYGTLEDFARCYTPSWGRHRARTRPSPGNHEFRITGGSDYFTYFGDNAGDPSKGYYSYDLGTWHIVSLNSNCVEVGGCEAGSAQEKWLRADLAEHPAKCTAAYWHHPLFSSGQHGGTPKMMVDIWKDLYDAGAEIVINGHDHDYERFAPQDPSGKADSDRGIREFVVGTGGASLRKFPRKPVKNSEAHDDRTWGVLKLTLHAGSYEWEFIPVPGSKFADSGSWPCH